MRWTPLVRRSAVALVGGLALAAALAPVAPVGAAPGAAGAGPAPPRAPASSPPADKVLILSVPGLDWMLVHEERPPALGALLGRSAVASLSVRTDGPATSLAEGYATTGAGTRAAGAEGPALVPPGQVAPPVVAVLEEVLAANRALGYGGEPGALGQALADSGRRAAVVANADVVAPTGERRPHREAALALMDRQGRVQGGTVAAELAIDDPGAPGGLRTDAEATLEAFSAAWSSSEVVLLEAGDLARIDLAGIDLAGIDLAGVDPARADLAPAPSGQPVALARRRALERIDALVGAALAEVDPGRHAVVLVAPLSARPGRDGLTVAALAGPGLSPGLATSSSTNRTGLVTLPDVAPSVLGTLGLEVPASMVGAPITAGQGRRPDAAVFEELAAAGEVSSFRDDATGPFSVAFVVLQLLTYGLAGAALTRWPRLAPLAGFLALVTLAQPSLAFLSGLLRYDRLGVVGYVLALFAGGVALAACAAALARLSAARSGPARPLVAPLLLVGFTLVVLVGDVLAGGPLQIDTVFGYSPVVAGRFTGYGNLAFALVSMAALVLGTGIWAAAALTQRASAPHPRTAWLAGVAVLLAVVVVADGHPALGADVGGVLALVPAALVAVVLLSGARVRLRQGLAIAVATAVVVAAFAAVDLARPAAERTHVGRFAGQVLDGGEGVAMVIERKIDANLSLLFSSVWALILPVALALLVVVFRRRGRVSRRLVAEVPGLRACLVAALVLAVLGGALNDSGVAVPAMMLAVLLPYVTVLAVTLPRPSEVTGPGGAGPSAGPGAAVPPTGPAMSQS